MDGTVNVSVPGSTSVPSSQGLSAGKRLGHIREASSTVAMLARLSRDLPGFLRDPITLEQAKAIVKRRLEMRPARFLRMAERAIYRYPRSPYLRLLRIVGCELGDLRALVDCEGVEGALATLADQGVYITFDEFKGRCEIVRGSHRFAPPEAEFDNPHFPAHFQIMTGGTRSPGTMVNVPIQFVEELAVDFAVLLEAHGVADLEPTIWLTAPLRDLLMYAKLNQPALAWFYPLEPLPWKVRLAGHYLHIFGRLLRCPFPKPAWVDLREAGRVARWLAWRRALGRSTALRTFASSAARVAHEAREQGLSLEGVLFITLGDAFTEAKQRALEAVGARALVTYGFFEAGAISYGCAEPRSSDDTHLMDDCFATIRRARTVGDFDFSIDALLFTSLLPSAPKILLNVESGDYAVFDRRSCGCLLGAFGLENHISQIRSFEKLMSEGMTFVKTRLVHVLEELLPRRFGGSSADYQLLEEEGREGMLRLLLLVSPRVGPLGEAELKQTFLGELRRGGELEGYMARMWERAGTVEVRREEPRATRAGKILPFHLIKAAQ